MTGPAILRYRASPLARIALLAYLLLIAYASWYPFTGWRSIGLGPLDYLSAPMPRYWTLFDVAINVVGYAPFGLLVVFALHPLIRGIWAALLAILSGTLLSGTMEAVQTYLPSRVASNLDLITNVSGATLGGLAGMFLVHALLERSRLRLLQRRWFLRKSSAALIVLALWPLAQLYPQGYLFGHGQITPILSGWLSSLLSMEIDLGAMLRHAPLLNAEQYWLSETIITACGLCGALLSMQCLLRRNAPKVALSIALIVATLTGKTLASALLFGPENAFAWYTPGAEGGLVMGALMLSGMVFTRPPIQRRLAVLMLLVSLLAVNSVPANPYFVATLQTWVQGKFLNFNGAAQFLSLAWPFVTLWFLLRSPKG